MRIIMDGKEMTVNAGENDLGAYIEALLKKEDRVIKKITVNGVEVVNLYLEEVLAGAAADKEVIIETVQAAELTREALREAAAYIPRLRKGLPVLRDRVLEGNTAEARKRLDEAVEGLEWLLLALRAFIKTTPSKGRELMPEEDFSTFCTVFKELESALHKDDLILICDICEYEIVPLLEQLERRVGSIVQQDR